MIEISVGPPVSLKTVTCDATRIADRPQSYAIGFLEMVTGRLVSLKIRCVQCHLVYQRAAERDFRTFGHTHESSVSPKVWLLQCYQTSKRAGSRRVRLLRDTRQFSCFSEILLYSVPRGIQPDRRTKPWDSWRYSIVNRNYLIPPIFPSFDHEVSPHFLARAAQNIPSLRIGRFSLPSDPLMPPASDLLVFESDFQCVQTKFCLLLSLFCLIS